MSTEHLGSLKKFYKKFRRLPSYSEMLKLFGFSSKNAVFKVIHKLVEEGLLNKDDGNKIAPTSQFFSLPLLGVIKAGYPILADEEKSYLTIDEYLIRDPLSSFLLKVSGDSMAGLGIFEGDIVIVERKKEARPGDVVLAQIDREWTLKVLQKDDKRAITYLMPANPKYPDLYPKEDLQIYGVVRGVVRKFN